MKKLLLFICVLLTGISGAWAKTQLAYNTLTTGVDYVLADNGQSWFLAQSGKTGCIIENNKYQLVAADVAGQYYLKQTSTGKYIATAGTGNASWTSDQASAEKFTIDKKDNNYQVRFVATSNGYFLNSASTSSNVCPKWHTGTGDWSYWYVYTYADVYADFVATLPQLTTDPSSPKYYSIKSYNRGGYLTSNGAGQGMTHVDFADGSAWYFTAADGNTSGNVTGGVIAHCSDGTQITTGWQTAATGGTIYILPNNVNGNGLSVSKTATISSWSCCDANNSNTGVGDWDPRANDWEGTTWVIEPTIPNGYYYFKGMDSGRYPYLYSNFVSKGENATYHHSPLAGTNGEIWKVTNNGGTLTAINGEGLPVTTSSQSDAPYTLTSYETLTIGSVAVGPDYYFTEAINLTSWGNDTRLTTWTDGGSGPADNRWTFDPADVSAGVYSVVIEGSNDGYVTYNSQNAKDGGFFVAASIAVGDLTAHPIDGYNNTISVEGNTITVLYEYQATLEYSLNGGTYTGTYPGIAGTTVPEFTGCVGYTLTDESWDGTTYSATINFPFAVSTPTFIGQFHNKNLYNSRDFLWHANGTSVVVHSGDLPDETSDEQNKYLWEIEPVIDGLNITFKIKNVYTGTYIYSTTTDNSHSGAVTLSETATPVTYNNPAGTGTCSPIYAFFLPSTSKYLSVGSISGGANSQLGVYGTVHDGISVGFHTYADLIDCYWANNGIAGKIAKVGQCGYPAITETNYLYLTNVKGALERGLYAGTAENFSNLVTWYKGFLAADVVKPEVGKFYKFKSANNRYIHAVTPGNIMQMNADGSSADAIFYIPYAGRFLSYTKGYAMSGRTIYNGFYNSGGYSTYTIDHYAGHGLGTIRIKGGNFLFDYSGSTDIYDSSNGTDANRYWTVEEVTSLPVTISSAGYATLYSPVALTIPGGVTAYVATDMGEYLHLDAINDGIIPAGTGVILKGAAGTYNFEITTGGTAESALTGTIATIAKPEGAYYLSNGDSGIGFYKEGSATTLAGFKAYLDGSAGTKGFLAFNFGDAVAIKAVSDALQSEMQTIYNLAGQRVNKLQRGVNIVNGRKVIVK